MRFCSPEEMILQHVSILYKQFYFLPYESHNTKFKLGMLNDNRKTGYRLVLVFRETIIEFISFTILPQRKLHYDDKQCQKTSSHEIACNNH